MKRFIVFAWLCLMMAGGFCQTGKYDIGVYYFPGWKDKTPYAPASVPWERIKPFAKEREPDKSWYQEGDIALMDKQLLQMHDATIDYVSFDWYWDENENTGKSQVYLNHAIDAYKQAPNNKLVKYSVMWANHNTAPTSQQDWENIVNYWVDNYFKTPTYKKIDDYPFVTIFSVEQLEINAKLFGKTVRNLVDSAQTIAQKAGLPGIHFVCSSVSNDDYYVNAGCKAMSIYNMHQNAQGTISHSYPELDAGYQLIWHRILNGNQEQKLPYILPMTSGWNKKPWGGSSDTLHDDSVSTPLTFQRHLEAAKRTMDSYPQGTMRMGVICCWNEYGEGSYIEPTKRWGTQYIDAVRRVFGGD